MCPNYTIIVIHHVLNILVVIYLAQNVTCSNYLHNCNNLVAQNNINTNPSTPNNPPQ